MTKKELLAKLKQIDFDYGRDQEVAHSMVDDALLEYIDDKDITEAFNAIEKWYA